MTPTHTHKTQGGRFTMLAHYNGDTSLDAQMIVVYRDLEREIETATTAKDWEANWRPIEPDTCTVCMGTGRDAIKGNKANPCGGCYGLGRVKADGETPKGEWEVAEVAGRVIAELHREIAGLQSQLATPGVAEAIKAEWARRQQAATDAQAEQERKWREGRGHGPGGARYTGD